jgi:hypothetical protein
LILFSALFAAQGTEAQNGVENVVTWGATAQVIDRYGGSEILPKSEKMLIHDFAVPADDRFKVTAP